MKKETKEKVIKGIGVAVGLTVTISTEIVLKRVMDTFIPGGSTAIDAVKKVGIRVARLAIAGAAGAYTEDATVKMIKLADEKSEEIIAKFESKEAETA